jgi:hypothetical protein
MLKLHLTLLLFTFIMAALTSFAYVNGMFYHSLIFFFGYLIWVIGLFWEQGKEKEEEKI